MPRLIIYKLDGEIIHAQAVNSSHSPNHLTEELIGRFRAALADGGMRAILIDEHIRAETHHVRHAKESLAIIGKGETRFAFLEPMRNMLRPSAKLFQSEDPAKRIEFVVAPADPAKVKLQPGVTIYVPIVGRWYCLASLLRCLSKMDHIDEVPVDLMIHDNSLDPEMERVLRAFLASQTRYRSISYHRDIHEKALALPELAYRTAAVYQRAITVCDTHFLLTIEDDVLPRQDVLPRLYRRIMAHGRGCAAVAAEVAERRECHSMCWLYENGEMRYVPTGEKLDAVSFSCTLYQTRPLKGLGMVPRWKDGPVATDIALWARLREEGYHAACEWGCGC